MEGWEVGGGKGAVARTHYCSTRAVRVGSDSRFDKNTVLLSTFESIVKTIIAFIGQMLTIDREDIGHLRVGARG
jgi:hypothetical protein